MDQASLDAYLADATRHVRQKLGREYEVRYEGMPRGPFGGHLYRVYRKTETFRHSEPTALEAKSLDTLRELIDAGAPVSHPAEDSRP